MDRHAAGTPDGTLRLFRHSLGSYRQIRGNENVVLARCRVRHLARDLLHEDPRGFGKVRRPAQIATRRSRPLRGFKAKRDAPIEQRLPAAPAGVNSAAQEYMARKIMAEPGYRPRQLVVVLQVTYADRGF